MSVASKRRRTELISGEALQHQPKGDAIHDAASVTEQKDDFPPAVHKDDVPPATKPMVILHNEKNIAETKQMILPSLGERYAFTNCTIINCTFK